MPMSAAYRVTLAIFLSPVAATAFADAGNTSCPAELRGHRLSRAAIFDGPSARLAEIIPLTGGWQLDEKYWSSEGFHLVCSYRGTAETLDIPLSRHIRACLFTTDWNVQCRGAPANPR